jgi:hypothetical protein
MRLVAWSAAASVALVAVHLALGGASYAPAQVADPCEERAWRDPGGFAEVGEQVVLSALDGAACELGASREQLVLALAGGDSLRRFADEQGISPDELERLVRAGLVRAVDDAVRADALNGTLATVLRALASRVPVEEVLDLLDAL